MGTRKNFFVINRQVGHTPSKRFASPDLEHSAVAGQTSQTGNMISTEGVSRVVKVTGGASVGLLTLIAEATVSQSLCLSALTYFAMRTLRAPNQSRFYTHCKYY